MKFAAAMLWCSVVSSLDIISSALNHSVMMTIEANPIQKFIIENYGLFYAMGLRAFSTSLAVVCILAVRRYKPLYGFALVACWSVQQLLVFVTIAEYWLFQDILQMCGLIEVLCAVNRMLMQHGW